MLRKTLETDAINQLVDACFRKYPNGLVTNVQKGKVPSQYQSVARYVAKYVVSPPIAVRRIDHYDGERVKPRRAPAFGPARQTAEPVKFEAERYQWNS